MWRTSSERTSTRRYPMCHSGPQPRCPQDDDHEDPPRPRPLPPHSQSLHRRAAARSIPVLRHRSGHYWRARTCLSIQYKRPENETSYKIFHQQEVAKQVPVLENNAKREAQLEAENRLYEQTRLALANKFTRPEGQDAALDSLSREIPDILTGEIFRPKPSTGT